MSVIVVNSISADILATCHGHFLFIVKAYKLYVNYFCSHSNHRELPAISVPILATQVAIYFHLYFSHTGGTLFSPTFYEGYLISLAILILGHCESGHCHLHYNVLHTRNKRHKMSKESTIEKVNAIGLGW